MAKLVAVDSETWASTTAESHAFAAEQLLNLAVDRSPASELHFNTEQVSAVNEFLLQHYFAHFRLYKYVLSARPRLTLEQQEPNGLMVPANLPPLADAIPLQAAPSRKK
jgi:hypothetical protein